MTMATAYVGVLGVRGSDRAADFQTLKNRAMLVGIAAATLLAQGYQLLLQCNQAIYPRLDVMDVLVDQIVNVLTLVLRAVAKGQQTADFVQGHVQDAAVADERQAFDMGLGIETVIAITAGRWR